VNPEKRYWNQQLCTKNNGMEVLIETLSAEVTTTTKNIKPANNLTLARSQVVLGMHGGLDILLDIAG